LELSSRKTAKVYREVGEGFVNVWDDVVKIGRGLVI